MWLCLLGLLAWAPVAWAASFEFWYSHSGSTAQAVLQLCEGFNASQQQHRVRCVMPGSYEQTMQKTIAAYRAGQQPALVEIYDVGTLDMMLSGAIVPVFRLMAQNGYRIDWQDYLTAVRSYYAGADDEFYSLPFNVSTAVLYANLDKLRAAGVTQTPRTWHDLELAASKLKAAGEACPLVSDFNPWILLEQVSTIEGAAIATRDNGHAGLDARYRFDRGVHLRFMEDVMRWWRQHLIVPAAATRTGRHTLAFTTGECAMVLDSTSAWQVIGQSALEQVDVQPLPVYVEGQRHSSVPGGASLWVMKGFKADVYAAVAAFIAYLQQPDKQVLLACQTGYLPVTRSAAALIAATGNTCPAAINAGIRSLNPPQGLASHGPRLGFFPQLRQAWSEEVQVALADRQDMPTALARARQRGDRLLQRFMQTYPDTPPP